MDVPHPLQTLLQFLVTDASSTAHLSYILDHLSPACLAPSPHLQKWVTRVTSLMHSKDPAARWAAICIAHRMSFLSSSLLIESAQTWVGIVFPSLLKPEPVPILKASIRYLILVLRVAQHNLEFQRQIALPVLPKVSSALLTIAEKHNDRDIKTSSIQALAQLVPLYPSVHKALKQRLFGLCNEIFGGVVNHVTDSLLGATVNLYAVLHFLGGKVGGVNLWRNCLDEVLQFSWSAWLALRTTFPSSGQLSYKIAGYLRSSNDKSPNLVLNADTTVSNPLETVALNLNRLKCGVSAIDALLRAAVNRPVKLPIGHFVSLCMCLLESTLEDEGQIHLDPFARAAESAVVPQIWVQACRLLTCLAETAQSLLAPHSSRLIMIISSHLENDLDQSQRLSFLQCAYHLLYFCPVVGAALGINRLLKAAMLTVSPLYHRLSLTETSSGAAGQPRPTKKRRQEFDVDNVLSATNGTGYETVEECVTYITALDVVAQCMLNPELVPSTRSLANRVLLSILLVLPLTAPSSLSRNPSFYGRVVKKVRDICFESVQGTSYAMSKGSSLFLRSYFSENLLARDKLHLHVDLLLHPRRPPFVQTLPSVEPFSFGEESAEETVTRHSLDLASGSGGIRSVTPQRQNLPDSVARNSLTPDTQTAIGAPNAGVLPPSMEPQMQTTSNGDDGLVMELATPPPVPPGSSSQVVAHTPVGSPSLNCEKVPVPSVCGMPMLVDESDHEVPSIDLGSDSDA